jgi:hypothetical protein
MRDAVVQDCDDPGIANQDLVGAAGGRIAEKCGSHVVVDQFADRPEFGAEQSDDHRRLTDVER